MTIKPQAVGSDDFRDLVLYNNILVDKSLFIKEVLDDSGKIILITRPRRWGKTLNMDMLRRFLEIEIDEQGNPLPEEERVNRKLFCGGEIDLGLASGKKKVLARLKIADYPDPIVDSQGQFPVVFITFKSIDGEDYQSIEDRAKEQICTLFRQHSYLDTSNKLQTFEQEDVKKYLDKNVNTVDLERSLKFLTGILYKHYGKKAWVLIDEYDAPINNAYRNFGDNASEFKKVINLFKGMMVSVFKKETGDPEIPVQRGVITGILRIAKAELFSSLNNVSEYSILDKNFSDHYGFLQEEVQQLLTQVNIIKPEGIKSWYNGYIFGGILVYNPWSVMQCLARNGTLDNYWIDTGGTGLLDKSLVSDALQNDLQTLLEGGEIIKRIYKQISLLEIETNSDIFFSLLLFAGYLNAEKASDDEEETRYKLTIPNKEVRNIYLDRVIDWVRLKVNISVSDYENFVELLTMQKLDKFKEKFSEYLMNSTSYHDLTKEKDYHNLMGGILAPLVRKYMIESNKESGLGRFDHMLVPIEGKSDTAIIIEYKILKTKEIKDSQNTLASLARSALDQIDASQYYAKAKSYAHVKKIAKIGIAFCGKEMDMMYKLENAHAL